MMLIALLLAAAQADRLPPANPLPPPTIGEEGAVMAAVNAVFAGIAAHDAAAIGAHLRADADLTIALERDDGTREIRSIPRADYLAGVKPRPERFEERLTDMAIEVDGDIAMVWGPYLFLIDGKISHCGVDHFDLVRENGRWTIANITWSQRTRGCGN